MNTLGRHLLAEFYGCTDGALDDVDRMRDHMLAAVKAVGATVVGEAFHRYEPHGVSGMLLIAESHLTVHSWPESRYVAVDIFTCGGLDPRHGYALLRQLLASETCRMHEIVRGLPADLEGEVFPEDVTILCRP